MNKALVLVACVAMSGCAGTLKMTPEQQVNLINALADAGCSGRVHLDAGGGIGQLGGEFHGAFVADTACEADKRRPVVVPLNKATAADVSGQ